MKPRETSGEGWSDTRGGDTEVVVIQICQHRLRFRGYARQPPLGHHIVRLYLIVRGAIPREFDPDRDWVIPLRLNPQGNLIQTGIGWIPLIALNPCGV